MKIALVKENVVEQVKEMTESEVLSVSHMYTACIDVSSYNPMPEPGWILSGNTLINTLNTLPTMRITKLALRQRFTISELTAIYNAMNTIPIVKILMDNLMVSTFVDLSRPDTVAGLNVLVAYGLITSDRANTILTTVPSAVEKYTG
jgi:uncharacterized alkaline shock family protein YloU